MPNIKAHYFVSNIALHKKHPRDGGVLLAPVVAGIYDHSQAPEYSGRVDILSKFLLDGELAFYKVRTVARLDGRNEVEGWTWADNVQIKFDEPKMDGRFNLNYHDTVDVVIEASNGEDE